jgi:FdhD protein
MNIFTKEVVTYNYSSDGLSKSECDVIIEKSVGISINANHWLNLMCTPSDLDLLAVGFMFNEGIINSADEIKMVDICQDGSNIDIWLKHTVEQPQTWQRTSGCSGGVTSVKLSEMTKVRHPEVAIYPNKISELIDKLLKSQTLYTQSGGVHSSALSEGKEILVVMEDIGRHNTLDKIAGKCLMEIGFPSPAMLLTTGRISSEMLQKAARMGANMVISRTAASSLAIEYAQKMGICLIGYARKDRFKVYTHYEFIAHY